MSDLEAAFLTLWRTLYPDLPAPEAQYRFAPPRRWRWDFSWPAALVAVELDGGTWTDGRHVRGDGYERDCEKGNAAASLGWRVWHLTAGMLATDPARHLAGIAEAVREEGER